VTRWGFVGLGEMGQPMAVSLARSGMPLIVLHRHAPGREAARAAGARIAADAAELADDSEVIGICVKDEKQVDELLQGPSGLYALAKPGTLFVIHSTVAPEACVRIAAEAAEHGLGAIDAPVTGMPVRAQTGDLTIYVGGDAALLEKARSGLEKMGSTILLMGGVGTGQITKLVNNLISVTTIGLIAEAVELGVACGIEQEVLKAALRAGSADSFTLRQFDFFQTTWLSDQRGGIEDAARRAGKDLNLALKLARDHLMDLPLAGLALAILPQAVARTVIKRPAPR
jgi:3-hydroxyisobutyrate dehydrogenase-like beta-hydroxyacid dehydrogenase